MLQAILRVFLLLSAVGLCASRHFSLKGWEAIPVDDKAADSMMLAADHLKGTLKEPVTAFKWIEKIPEWDLYRVSFVARFQLGDTYECHADVNWTFNPLNASVFNTGCLEGTIHPTRHEENRWNKVERPKNPASNREEYFPMAMREHFIPLAL